MVEIPYLEVESINNLYFKKVFVFGWRSHEHFARRGSWKKEKLAIIVHQSWKYKETLYWLLRKFLFFDYVIKFGFLSSCYTYSSRKICRTLRKFYLNCPSSLRTQNDEKFSNFAFKILLHFAKKEKRNKCGRRNYLTRSLPTIYETSPSLIEKTSGLQNVQSIKNIIFYTSVKTYKFSSLSMIFWNCISNTLGAL